MEVQKRSSCPRQQVALLHGIGEVTVVQYSVLLRSRLGMMYTIWVTVVIYRAVLRLLSTFYMCVNQESERLGRLPKATQLNKGQNQDSSSRGSCLKACLLILKNPKTPQSPTKHTNEPNQKHHHIRNWQDHKSKVVGLLVIFMYSDFLFILFRPF